jgi:hypothetical protein
MKSTANNNNHRDHRGKGEKLRIIFVGTQHGRRRSIPKGSNMGSPR